VGVAASVDLRLPILRQLLSCVLTNRLQKPVPRLSSRRVRFEERLGDQARQRAHHAAEPEAQLWAAAMADTLCDAHHAAQAARAAGHPALDPAVLTVIRRRYRGAASKGITDNTTRAGPLARDAATLARRFREHEDMILRFTVDLAVPFTNNQAERDVRPVKIQQRTSGGCWRTLAGLADFAVVQSYLSTAAKWGLDSFEVLHQLFTTGAWLPPAATPG